MSVGARGPHTPERSEGVLLLLCLKFGSIKISAFTRLKFGFEQLAFFPA